MFVLILVAAILPTALAQDANVSPPVTIRGFAPAIPAQANTEPTTKRGFYYPPFCPAKTCLYYAGDFESSYSEDNGLFNADYTGGELEGQAWVGVKPDRDVTVTGATFLEEFTAGYTGVNPTAFALQVGIKPGQAGQTICSTSGNATISLYEDFQIAQIYSYSIKKLSQPCKLKKGTVYYVNVLPTASNGYGYVMNVPPKSPPNHHGWKNDLDDCYFNGVAFGADYATCDSQGSGLAELSIALTGR
jgi:hypothetical protein